MSKTVEQKSINPCPASVCVCVFYFLPKLNLLVFVLTNVWLAFAWNYAESLPVCAVLCSSILARPNWFHSYVSASLIVPIQHGSTQCVYILHQRRKMQAISTRSPVHALLMLAVSVVRIQSLPGESPCMRVLFTLQISIKTISSTAMCKLNITNMLLP